MDLKINYYSEDTSFNHIKKTEASVSLTKIILAEKPVSGVINFIFCSDKYLSILNVRFLKHKTLTDIITFENYYSKNNLIADVYISIDRVKDNAKKYKALFEKELYRVMIHGILHLMGYSDKTKKQKAIMTKKENIYLKMFHVKPKR